MNPNPTQRKAMEAAIEEAEASLGRCRYELESSTPEGGKIWQAAISDIEQELRELQEGL